MKKTLLLVLPILLSLIAFSQQNQVVLENKDTLVQRTTRVSKITSSTFKINKVFQADTTVSGSISYDSIWYELKPYKPVIDPNPINKLPVVNAGTDKTITLPANSVVLAGAASDSDGNIISVRWSRMNGSGSVNPIDNLKTTVSGLQQGTSIYRLTATDNKGGVAFDDVQITVNAAPSGGQTFPLTFSQLTSDYSRPNGQAEIWYNTWQYPISGITPQDRYIRFSWSAFQSTDPNAYNWNIFNQEINKAIDAGQKFSFGVMTQYLGGRGSVGIATYDGGASAYPLFLHQQMQQESVKDRLIDGDWVPVYTSNSYLTAYENLCKALYNHINTTTYKGVLYKHAINFIDIRGYGNFGEWHNWPYGADVPTKPSAAILKRIVDAHKNNFPDIRLQAMISGVSAVDAWSPVTPEVAYYQLTETNQAGAFGIRRDNWGATESWYNQDAWENNPKSYNGVQLKNLIMDKWKTAPITGEPCCNSNYSALRDQVIKYHVTSFGNGNVPGSNNTIAANFANASKAAGYKVTLTGGSITTNAGSLKVNLNWANNGIVPVYEKWDVTYQLIPVNGGKTIEYISPSFTVTMLQPGTAKSEDVISGIPSGTYNLLLKVTDPNGYRKGFPLAIIGANNFAYTLKNNVVIP